MNSRDLIALINAAPPAGKGRRSVKFEIPARVFEDELALNFGKATIKARVLRRFTNIMLEPRTEVRVWVDEAIEALEAAGLLTHTPPEETKPGLRLVDEPHSESIH